MTGLEQIIRKFNVKTQEAAHQLYEPIRDYYGEHIKPLVDITKGTIEEGLHDKRLWYSLGLDAVGAASTLGWLAGLPGAAGDLVDIGYAPFQTYMLNRLYGGELEKNQKAVLSVVSFLEELLPFATDLLPTMTITHFVSAYNRFTDRYYGRTVEAEAVQKKTPLLT